MTPAQRPAMLAALLLTACPGPKPDDSIPAPDTGLDPATVPLEGACPDTTRLGRFTIARTESYAYVTGELLDGVVPATVQEPSTSEGECTLLVRENPYCHPACDADETCDFDGECIPYPSSQDLGTVRVYGLLQDVAMEPVSPGYTYFDTSLPNPPWDPGALLTLQTGAGAFDPVALHGVAPEDLSSDATTWEIVSGEPLAISWEPAQDGARSQVRVTLMVDLHGITPAMMECWFADDGQGEVPADLLGEFLGLGITGFPEGSFARLTADQAAVGEGCADLWSTVALTPEISIDGYTPCREDDDCPDGQECNEELERCE